MTLVSDHTGATYEVSETRYGPDGLMLYRGRPYPRPKRHGSGGGNRFVLTAELLAYLRTHSLKDCALPIARNAAKRLRREAGLDAPAERYAWWLDRIEDLGSMTGAEFAAAHPMPARTGKARMVHVTEGQVSVMRQRLLGRAIRPAGWWRAPEVLAYLRDGVLIRDAARALDVAPGTIGKLRWMARHDPTITLPSP